MPKKQKPEYLKTRADLSDREWLDWLAALDEYRGISIVDLFDKMLDWCEKKQVTPTRLRLLNWLNREAEAVPMKPVSLKPPCKACDGTKRVQTNDFKAPCHVCCADEARIFWRNRGK